MKISEIITDKYKLRIPPTVYYELLADVQEVEEDQEPTTKTCKTCRNYGSHNGVCDICKDYNCFTEPNKSEIPNNSTTKNDLSSGLEKNSKKLEKGTTKNDLGVGAVSRKAVQTRLKEIINEMETIFADIREREVNDSVCGLCEYDCDHGLDGYANECPGFEKDDCFKLNEKYKAEWLDISNLSSVTPIRPKGHWIETAEEYYKAINEKGGGVNENTDFFTDDIACSECLAKFSVIDNQADRFDFCPCCGSDNR